MNAELLNKIVLLSMLFVLGIAIGLIVSHDIQYENAQNYAEEQIFEHCTDNNVFNNDFIPGGINIYQDGDINIK